MKRLETTKAAATVLAMIAVVFVLLEAGFLLPAPSQPLLDPEGMDIPARGETND